MTITKRIRHWCMDCPLTFTDDASANAHHDEVGHKQTFRQQMAYQRGLMPITPDKPIAWMVTARGARFTYHYLDIAEHVRQGFIDEYGADDVADLVPLYTHPAQGSAADERALDELGEMKDLIEEVSWKIGVGSDGARSYADTLRLFVEAYESLSQAFASAVCDTARLDWLQEQHRGIEAGTMDDQFGEPTRKLFVVDGAGVDALMHEIREAIDRAQERYPNPPRDEEGGYAAAIPDEGSLTEADPTKEGWVP